MMQSNSVKTPTSGPKRGQILLVTALGIVATIGIAGLAVDVGELWKTRRQMQTAADAAAIAGANDLAVQDTTDVVNDARNAAGTNGFANGGTTAFSDSAISVTVTSPPTSGTYSGNSNAVMVTVAENQPTQFLRLLGYSSIPVSASSTGLTVTGGSCIYSLDPTGFGAMTIAGTSTVSSSCGLYDDSNNSSALIASGGGAITAPLVGVVGGTTVNGGGDPDHNPDSRFRRSVGLHS